MKKKKKLRPPFYILIAIIIFIILNILKQELVIGQATNIGEINEMINIDVEDTIITMSVIGDIMCHNTQYYDAYNNRNV